MIEYTLAVKVIILLVATIAGAFTLATVQRLTEGKNFFGKVIFNTTFMLYSGYILALSLWAFL